MKKIILPLLLLAAGYANAATGDVTPLNNWKSRQAANGDVVLKVIQTDPSGTPFPTPSGGSGSAVVVTNTTPIPVSVIAFTPTVNVNVLVVPTPTPGYLPVSPVAQTYPMYEASATYLTSATTTYNLSSTANTTKGMNVTVRANRGGTSIIYAINASQTPQATVATLDGREVITGASHKTEGPCYTPGTFIHMRASGTASVVGTLIIEECR